MLTKHPLQPRTPPEPPKPLEMETVTDWAFWYGGDQWLTITIREGDRIRYDGRTDRYLVAYKDGSGDQIPANHKDLRLVRIAAPRQAPKLEQK